MPACPNCGRANDDDARFCSSCGAELARAGSPREQRKVVTVLFCDLVGSTALGESADPEVVRARMRRYFEDLRTILERHGGTVEKFVGDAVMAVFGIPMAHEDDALRAVRAAWEMREVIATSELEARFGVNTGEVVVGGEGETLVTGDAVNVAARLEQSAAAGEVLIGAETRLLVRDAVVVEPLAPLGLKGKAAPVEAFRLVDVIGDASPIARDLEAPLVGRERTATSLARLRGLGRRSHVPALHAPRASRHRQVAPRGRLPRACRGLRRGPARPLPLVRRGHHLLAARRDARPARYRPRERRRIHARRDARRLSQAARGPGQRAAFDTC